MSELVELGFVNAALTTLLAVVFWLVTRFWRQPVLVHALWVLVLLKLVTPPMIAIPWRPVDVPAFVSAHTLTDVNSLFNLSIPVSEGTVVFKSSPSAAKPLALLEPTESIHAVAANDPTAESAEDRLPLATGDSYSWSTIGGMAWLAGSAIFLAIALLRLARFQRALAHATPAPQQLCELAAHVAERFGISGGYRLRVTEARLSPLVWPVGRPTIVLARLLVAELSPEEIETLLAHEFAHLRRKDHWIRWLELAAVTLYWWHPVAWWARKAIHQSEEQACDAWVVWAYPDAARRYASALFTACEFVTESRSAAPLVASRLDVGGNLKNRIETIMNGNCDLRLSLLNKLWILVLALLVLPLSLRAVRAADEEQATEAQVTELPAAAIPVISGDTLDIPTTTTAAPAISQPSKIEQEIGRRLQTPVELDYVETPLEEVMAQLGNFVRVDIHLDHTGLDQEGVSVDAPVTIRLKNKVSLRSALNLILKPLHLTFVTEDEVLKITNQQVPTAPATKVATAVERVSPATPSALDYKSVKPIATAASVPSESVLSTSVWKKIVESKKQSYERVNSLAKKNVVSAAELEKAKYDYEIHVAKYEQSLRALKYSQLLVELAEIEYQEAVEKNKAGAGSVSELEVQKLWIKVELAKAKLAELAD